MDVDATCGGEVEIDMKSGGQLVLDEPTKIDAADVDRAVGREKVHRTVDVAVFGILRKGERLLAKADRFGGRQVDEVERDLR